MKFHGKFHKIPWNSKEFHGIQWNYPWSSMEFHGIPSIDGI
jgi:hypothetical protein